MTKTITDIDGVYASSIHCGIKAKKKDLTVIYVPGAVGSAGVFTQNLFCAPSVSYTRKLMKRHTLKAMIINSGNANAGTGENGVVNNKVMSKKAAECLGLMSREVGVSSTGIIGVQLPMDVVESGIRTLCSDAMKKEGDKAAEGILTTDTFTKQVFKSAKIGKKTISVAGIAKGSGMIEPNMATMLGYIVTDADIDSAMLQQWLSDAVEGTFNSISVDSDTSTSDMVVAFATGETKFNVKDLGEREQFFELLKAVCRELAILIARDGEGATKLIEVNVTGANSYKDAKAVAKNIVNSPLVKTAIHGEDPNWGRLIMAVGKNHDVKLNPNKVEILLQGITVFKDGLPTSFDRQDVHEALKVKDVVIDVNLHVKSSSSTVWGCDLSKGYIDINTAYN